MDEEAKNRWQTNITSITEGIQHIYNSKEFSDVTFLVQGKAFKAHKLVLASRSSELARILMAPSAPDEFVVPQTITESGFKIFLSFIYTNCLNAVDKKSVVEAYQCAKYYEQRALQNRCLEEIKSWVIDVQDACQLLGMDCDIPALREKCIAFVRANGCKVAASEEFTKASETTLTTVLASGALADVPVFQRIESVMNWGKRRFDITNADFSIVRQKLLDTKPPLLGKLGVENLKMEDLPNLLHNYPKLLTDKEVTQLILYWGSKNPADLPSWCTNK